MKAVRAFAVGDAYIRRSERKIVAAGLLYYLPGYLYVSGFAFYQHVGLPGGIKYQDIGSLAQCMVPGTQLGTDQVTGVAQAGNQKMYEGLPHLLFRGQYQVFFSYNIVYIGNAVFRFCFKT